jgi:F-type H+-transporting ATPase subunit gamma
VAELAPIDLQGMQLLQRREIKSVGIIVLSSDRGLCGSYNTTVLREAAQRIRTLIGEGKNVKLVMVGLKAVGFFKPIKDAKLEKVKTYTLLPAVPTVQEAKMIADEVADLYIQKKVDAVEIIGTKFKNMISSQVINVKYLPVALPEGKKHEALKPLQLFEPSVEEVLQKELLPKYIENVVYQMLLEATASELSARMQAMTNASNNARDLINSLTLVYNKARQASITQELLEIVGGAEALKG